MNGNNKKTIEVKVKSPAKIIEIDKNAGLMNEVKDWLNESKFHFKQEHNIDKVNVKFSKKTQKLFSLSKFYKNSIL